MGAGLHTETIKAIYDAALSDDRWRMALDRMVAATDSKCALMYDMNLTGTPTYSLSTASTFFHECGDALQRYNQMVAE